MPETNIVTGDGAPDTQVTPAAPAVPAAAPAVRGAVQQGDPNSVSWTASEFVSHEKSAGWYGTLVLVAAIVAIFIYLTTKDVISTVVVIIAAFVFAIIAGRKPRQLQYQISAGGVTIGHKRLGYDAFKSFSVVPEGAFSSIVFIPLKRFAPLTTIYYAPDDEAKIVDLLSLHLPLEEYKPDAFDKAMRRIRF